MAQCTHAHTEGLWPGEPVVLTSLFDHSLRKGARKSRLPSPLCSKVDPLLILPMAGLNWISFDTNHLWDPAFHMDQEL